MMGINWCGDFSAKARMLCKRKRTNLLIINQCGQDKFALPA